MYSYPLQNKFLLHSSTVIKRRREEGAWISVASASAAKFCSLARSISIQAAASAKCKCETDIHTTVLARSPLQNFGQTAKTCQKKSMRCDDKRREDRGTFQINFSTVLLKAAKVTEKIVIFSKPFRVKQNRARALGCPRVESRVKNCRCV